MKVKVLLILVNLIIASAAIGSFILVQKLDGIRFLNDWMIMCGVFLLATILLIPLIHMMKRERESTERE